ncbi:electron transport complex subunit RsxC [Aliikangiella sp. IMCC44359]|uniref:electron transport complex subunit RsxC n=1 Tax=Aliikangiella sp. IMCC44359 TaxID=3459125 RepID=UPI00403ACC05
MKKNTIQFDEIIQPVEGKFHGGIHPQEFKTLSNDRPIEKVNLPQQLIIPIQQSIGDSGKIIVSVGDKISSGQLLVDNNEVFGANIHSPLCGEITAIKPQYIGHPSGMKQLAISLKVDSKTITNFKAPSPQPDWKNSSAEDLLKQIKASGIVGLGGATFPTSVKLSATPINTLIVNAMECEPYITCDDRLLREQPENIILGAQIAAKIVNAKSIIFAIEDNKTEAINVLSKAIKQLSSKTSTVKITIKVAPTKYPSGGEKQTIELITGKQLPAGQLPASMGILIQNVATLHAVYQAIIYEKPLIDRLVTLTGNLIQKAGNYWIPFGMTINDIMSQFNIDTSRCERVIIGGPLMGQSVNDFNVPITKATNCLIFNSKDVDEKLWLTQSTQHQECIRCSECEKVCPVELLPQQLYWFSQSDQWENLENQGLFDCIECGACAYVCPSEIPLVQYYRYGKSVIRTNKNKQMLSEKAKQRFEFREMRLARAKAERALKHQRAAEARKKSANEETGNISNKKAAINEALERVKQKKAQQNAQPNGDQ